MNFARAYNYTIATLLIVIYLALPATSFAHAATLEVGFPSAEAPCCTAATAPCAGSPCPDEHGSGCCDKTFPANP